MSSIPSKPAPPIFAPSPYEEKKKGEIPMGAGPEISDPNKQKPITQKAAAADIETLNREGKEDGVNSSTYKQQEAKVGNDLTHLINLNKLVGDVDDIHTKDPFLNQIQKALNAFTACKDSSDTHKAAAELDHSMQKLSDMLKSPDYRSNPMQGLATNLVKSYYQTKSIQDGNRLNYLQNKHGIPEKDPALLKGKEDLASDLQHLLNVNDVKGAQYAINNIKEKGPVLAKIQKVLQDISFNPESTTKQSNTKLNESLHDLMKMKSSNESSPFWKLIETLDEKFSPPKNPDPTKSHLTPPPLQLTQQDPAQQKLWAEQFQTILTKAAETPDTIN